MLRIPTKTHAISDYVTAAALLAAPFILRRLGSKVSNVANEVAGTNGSSDGMLTAENVIPVALGSGMLLKSAFSDHEYGASRLMGMRTHLYTDLATGAFLAAAPWLFRFKNPAVRTACIALGVGEVAKALFTNTTPGDMVEEAGNMVEEALD